MDYKQSIIDSGFSAHEIADAHRASGSQNPPDWESIWEWLNDRSPGAGHNLQFWESNQAAAIRKRRQH